MFILEICFLKNPSTRNLFKSKFENFNYLYTKILQSNLILVEQKALPRYNHPLNCFYFSLPQIKFNLSQDQSFLRSNPTLPQISSTLPKIKLNPS